MDKTDLLLELAYRIKSFGFDVYVRHEDNDCCMWIIFTDGVNVAYAEIESFGYRNISSIHKPCSNHGSGISVLYRGLLSEVTKEVCDEALLIAPKWYRSQYKDLKGIKKWSVEEYFSTKKSQGYVYTQI